MHQKLFYLTIVRYSVGDWGPLNRPVPRPAALRSFVSSNIWPGRSSCGDRSVRAPPQGRTHTLQRVANAHDCGQPQTERRKYEVARVY